MTLSHKQDFNPDGTDRGQGTPSLKELLVGKAEAQWEVSLEGLMSGVVLQATAPTSINASDHHGAMHLPSGVNHLLTGLRSRRLGSPLEISHLPESLGERLSA